MSLKAANLLAKVALALLLARLLWDVSAPRGREGRRDAQARGTE